MANLDDVGRWPAQAPPQVLVLKGINKDEGVIINPGSADKDLGKEREWREGIRSEQSLPPEGSGSLGNRSGKRSRE